MHLLINNYLSDNQLSNNVDRNEARVSLWRFSPICIHLSLTTCLLSFEPNVTVTWLGNTRYVVLLMAPCDPHIRVLIMF